MKALTIFIMIVAVISAAMTNAIFKRRMLSARRAWFRSTVISGFTGFLAAIGIIAPYFNVNDVIWRMTQ